MPQPNKCRVLVELASIHYIIYGFYVVQSLAHAQFPDQTKTRNWGLVLIKNDVVEDYMHSGLTTLAVGPLVYTRELPSK